ncbi:CehA/McbA family metallohydrolase domain-containing protein [Algoriphagus antarcticus]|uniref:Polymerase/histidinol phosphatase N-terminal domain-containing protein n=1 Tax=Algoriphagus antarcticus TaxID=238540 RepID=A0A3E0DH91_9BACT|nr:hypothetical protein [Algoriphagus antarcticus]REG82038.1 hypothetical protein C8N25_12327 [Algoriphagus antarcticus]
MFKLIGKAAMLIILVGLLAGVIFYLGPGFYNKWVVYPRMERSRDELWATYQKPISTIPIPEYTGVMHVHSYWSHDSRGSLKEILKGAKEAGLNFIFFSDHAHSKLDTFPRSFHGLFDGILFEAGTESSGEDGGMMVNPFKSGVLNWEKPRDSVIREIVDQGGLVTYVHSEKDHDWDNPDYQAMEIYNIHSDLLDEKGILPFLLNHLVMGDTYKDWAYRELYDKQESILANWDGLNQRRRIVGVGAVDAHNNLNIRAQVIGNGQVEWVGPNAETISIREPGFLEKILLHEPDEMGWSWKWELDTYFHSFNFVNNHVFSEGFTSEEIKESIKKGNSFIAFEGLAKAKGFQFFAQNQAQELKGILGDSIPVEEVWQLSVLSPFPAKYRLIRDGKVIEETKEASYEFVFPSVYQKGNYRIEADLWLNDSWVNWIFTNPIYLY